MQHLWAGSAGTLDAHRWGMFSLYSAAPSLFQPIARAGLPRTRSEAAFTNNGVMVCLPSDPSRLPALFRKGLETAGELGGRLYLVHVETLADSMLGRARELHILLEGSPEVNERAEVVWLKALDPAAALLDFARKAHVGIIVVGRSGARTRKTVLRRSVCRKLIDEARHCAIEIVGFAKSTPSEMALE